MINKIKRNLFPFIIALSALSVSTSAAFYSVSGLSKLFAGAQFEVIIMAGSLEVAKLVIASLLYQYWDTINKFLRTYLAVAAVVLVLITSMGIYGFLSAAYQETYQKLIVNQNQIEFLENKAKFYEDDVIRYETDLERISSNISTLSNAKASSIQVRDTASSTGFRQTISTTELRLSQKRIDVEEINKKAIQAKREIAADSLQNIKLEVLALQNSSDTVGELGPLQYLSGLTQTPMDKIINILLLVIIFVFDPLAISLVIAANFAFDIANRRNLYGELEDDTVNLTSQEKFDRDFGLEDYDEEAEKRMDIIGRNGNDGEHYEDWTDKEDLKNIEVDYEHLQEEDWRVVDSEVEPKPIKIVQKGPSRHRVLFDDGQQRRVDKDDNIIKYL